MAFLPVDERPVHGCCSPEGAMTNLYPRDWSAAQ